MGMVTEPGLEISKAAIQLDRYSREIQDKPDPSSIGYVVDFIKQEEKRSNHVLFYNALLKSDYKENLKLISEVYDVIHSFIPDLELLAGSDKELFEYGKERLGRDRLAELRNFLAGLGNSYLAFGDSTVKRAA
jgi:hypothetical protein